MKFIKILVLSLIVHIGFSCAQFLERSQLFYGPYTDNFVMRWSFQEMCDHTFDPRITETLWPSKPEGETFDPLHVKRGDLIFVRDVKTFFETLHPHIQHPYIMITAGEFRDKVQEESINYLDDPKIIAWFSIHACERTHPKFHMIPLGILQRNEYYRQRGALNKVFAYWRNSPKPELLYMNFTHTNVHGDKGERPEVVDCFEQCSFCFKAERRPFLEYMKDMSRFKFVLSPSGYGPDTYRNWEAMLVGAIPIVRTSCLDPLYKGLPVLIINDWQEITQEFLEHKYKEMTAKKFNIKRLFMEYWWNKIETVRKAFLTDHSINLQIQPANSQMKPANSQVKPANSQVKPANLQMKPFTPFDSAKKATLLKLSELFAKPRQA